MNQKLDIQPFIPFKKIIPLGIEEGAGPGTPH